MRSSWAQPCETRHLTATHFDDAPGSLVIGNVQTVPLEIRRHRACRAGGAPFLARGRLRQRVNRLPDPTLTFRCSALVTEIELACPIRAFGDPGALIVRMVSDRRAFGGPIGERRWRIAAIVTTGVASPLDAAGWVATGTSGSDEHAPRRVSALAKVISLKISAPDIAGSSSDPGRFAGEAGEMMIDLCFWRLLEPNARPSQICVIGIQELDPGGLKRAPHGVDIGGRTATRPELTFHAHDCRQ